LLSYVIYIHDWTSGHSHEAPGVTVREAYLLSGSKRPGALMR